MKFLINLVEIKFINPFEFITRLVKLKYLIDKNK